MARFLIRNNRPRRMLTIDGQVLRAARRSRNLPAGEMWLTDERFTSRMITDLLRLKRAVVVDFEGVDQSALDRYLEDYVFVSNYSLDIDRGRALLFPEVEDEEPVRLPEVREVEAEPVMEPPTVEVAEVIEPDPEPVKVISTPAPVVEKQPELAPEEPKAPPAELPADDPTGPDTIKELQTMSYRALQGLASDLGLAANGKKAALVERIYAYQHEDS